MRNDGSASSPEQYQGMKTPQNTCFEAIAILELTHTLPRILGVCFVELNGKSIKFPSIIFLKIKNRSISELIRAISVRKHNIKRMG